MNIRRISIMIKLEDHLNELIRLGYLGAPELLNTFIKAVKSQANRDMYYASNTGSTSSINDSFDITYRKIVSGVNIDIQVAYIGIKIPFGRIRNDLYVGKVKTKTKCKKCALYLITNTPIKTCKDMTSNGTYGLHIITPSNIIPINNYFKNMAICTHECLTESSLSYNY